MIYLATGNDVAAARKALGVNQSVLGTYWCGPSGSPRGIISSWERCGTDHVPQPRVVGILLASLRRGWFPQGGQGIKKKRREPAQVVAGKAIADARALFDLQVGDLAAFWGLSRASVGHLELREVLPNSPMWDILLDDLLLQTRASILRWGTSRPPAVVPKKPRGRYAPKVVAEAATEQVPPCCGGGPQWGHAWGCHESLD